jgi:hypothetical protein
VTLKNWVKKTAGPQDFVEIKPPVPAPIGFIPKILIEKGDIKVHIPAAVKELTVGEVRMLLAGIDFWKAHKPVYYERVS